MLPFYIAHTSPRGIRAVTVNIQRNNHSKVPCNEQHSKEPAGATNGKGIYSEPREVFSSSLALPGEPREVFSSSLALPGEPREVLSSSLALPGEPREVFSSSLALPGKVCEVKQLVGD
ncbi:hypothetical protein NDU88_006350 [Pleurodeles waltl]|uniref:Uncharacterized protein n=1 Tax=Pleurodeles waltl TaxID=8319 RepID=A0AAV7LZY9_PLEWA|nr:hypothetical protein NDU88_006350 [Pleurodeles waltl]